MKKVTQTGIVIGILLLLGAAVAVQKTAGAPQPENTMNYSAYADELSLAEIIEAKDLTADMLQNRNGKFIIERCIGVVDDAESGAGHVLNEDPECNYISYRNVPGIVTGDVICSYFLYNPDNNYIDDIVLRYDYIIDSCAAES